MVSPKTKQRVKKLKEINISRAILFLFLFTTLSGAIRKWGTSSSAISNLILGIQIVMPFVFVFLIKKKKLLSTYRNLLGFYVILLLFFALNPLNATYFHGVLGFLLHFGFWLAILIYSSSRRFISQLPPLTYKVLIVLVVMEFLLAFVQYSLPHTHFINQYATEVTSISRVGEAVRVTGTFSYISGFSAFLIFSGMFIWSLTVNKQLSKSYLLILMGLQLVGSLMNGSRSIVFFSIIFLGIAFLQVFSIRSLPALILGVGLASTILLLNPSSSSTINTSYENFMGRVHSNAATGEQNDRIIGPLTEILDFKGNYPIAGIGLGSTYQGANLLFGESIYAQEYGGYEEEPERIILEGGYILFLFRIILFLVLFTALRIPGIYLGPLLLLAFFYLPIIFNIYNSVYFLLGLIMVDLAYYQKRLRYAR